MTAPQEPKYMIFEGSFAQEATFGDETRWDFWSGHPDGDPDGWNYLGSESASGGAEAG